MPSCGTGPLSCWSTSSVEQDARTRPWRIGPCASCVEKTVAPAWLAHDGPEEVALLLARRVVGQLVEQVVEHLHRRGELRRDHREVARGGPQNLDHRQRRTRERPQLVLDDRRRLVAGTAASAPARARARGRRAAGRRASARARCPARSTLASVVFVACSAPGSTCSDTRRFASWAANALKTLLDESTSAARSLLLAPSACESRRKLWIERRMLRVAHGQRAVEPGGVARGRLEALQRGRQRLALAVEPLARGAQKQLQVGARVARPARKDLVEVDVGQRLGDRDGAALRQPRPRCSCPGRAR